MRITLKRPILFSVAAAFVILCAVAAIFLLRSHPGPTRLVVGSGSTPGNAGASAAETIAAELAAPPSPSPGLTTSFTPTATVSGGQADAAVERAFATAVSLHWELGNPPLVNGVAVVPTASLLSSMLTADTTRIQSVFQPAQASYELKALNTAIQMQSQGFVLVGGGVSHITLSYVVVNGAQANVSALVTSWSDFKVPTQGKLAEAHPTNDNEVAMTLTDVSNTWMVTSMGLSTPAGELSP